MLKVNHGHKKIDTTLLKKSGVKILSQLMGATVALTMYSGFASIKASANSYSSDSSSYSEDEVNLADNYRDGVLEALGRTSGSITKDDLESLQNLELWIYNNNDSLRFVNDCTSLNELYLANMSDEIDVIKQIGKLDNLDTFTFDSGADTVDLNRENCRFLYNNSKIKKLQIYGAVMLEPELVYSMPNLESVAIEVSETTPLDLKKIPKLKEAYIYGEPYDISINVTADDVNYLLDNGVEVFLNSDTFEMMKQIDAKLDNIISTLNINENSTNQEKLDAIIMYALKHFRYDPTVDSMSSYDPNREATIKSFYEDGYLYGALERDTQLCGNYAAFITAIANRIGLESYMMMSDVHCWNLVKVDGDYYYVDTTWMDNNLHYDGSRYVHAEELFEKDDKEHIDWYMDEPKTYTDYDHQSYNYPEYLEDELRDSINKGVYSGIVLDSELSETSSVVETTNVDSLNSSKPSVTYSVEDEERRKPYRVPDISDEQYELMVNGTLVGVPASVLIGIMTAIGVAKKIKKKRNNRLNIENNIDNSNSMKR